MSKVIESSNAEIVKKYLQIFWIKKDIEKLLKDMLS